MLADGPLYTLRWVELNADGHVVAWQADAILTVENRNDIAPLLDEIRLSLAEPTVDEDALFGSAGTWDDE
jgi:hypothetical protein